MGWTEEEYQEYQKRQGTLTGAVERGKEKPNKYHAQRTNGYPSKKHAQFAAELSLRQKTGEVWYWLEEVAFKLPGNTKHRVDFMVFYEPEYLGMKRLGEGWELVECKGRDLPLGKLKRHQVEEFYHVKIRIV